MGSEECRGEGEGGENSRVVVRALRVMLMDGLKVVRESGCMID